jgi:hypothetical protein
MQKSNLNLQERINQYFSHLLIGSEFKMPDLNTYTHTLPFRFEGKKFTLNYGCEVTKVRNGYRLFFFCNFSLDYSEPNRVGSYTNLANLAGSSRTGKKNLFFNCDNDLVGLEQWMFECSDYIADFAETVRLPQKHHRSRNVAVITNAPILANTCYQQPFFQSNF